MSGRSKWARRTYQWFAVKISICVRLYQYVLAMVIVQCYRFGKNLPKFGQEQKLEWTR